MQPLLVLLVGVYQAQPALPELRPVAALMVRALHLLARDDDAFRQSARRLGLVSLLSQQLRHDTHWLDEPPVPAAAAAASALAAGAAGRLTGSPRAGGGRTPSGAASPRAGSLTPGGGGGGGGAFHEAPIPEDGELPPAAMGGGASPTHRGPASRSLGVLAARAAAEAAPLRGFGGGPTPLQRMAAAALLRAALAPVLPPAAAGALVHGVLLPALHMQLVGPRLSLSMEAAAALRSLMANSPDNQEAAARAGAVRPLAKVRQGARRAAPRGPACCDRGRAAGACADAHARRRRTPPPPPRARSSCLRTTSTSRARRQRR